MALKCRLHLFKRASETCAMMSNPMEYDSWETTSYLIARCWLFLVPPWRRSTACQPARRQSPRFSLVTSVQCGMNSFKAHSVSTDWNTGFKTSDDNFNALLPIGHVISVPLCYSKYGNAVPRILDVSGWSSNRMDGLSTIYKLRDLYGRSLKLLESDDRT